MRISGHVIGALTTTVATRRSVILSADGSDARLTFAWTKSASASAAARARQRQRPGSAEAERLEERTAVDRWAVRQSSIVLHGRFHRCSLPAMSTVVAVAPKPKSTRRLTKDQRLAANGQRPIRSDSGPEPVL